MVPAAGRREMVAKQKRTRRQHSGELTREEGWALVDEAPLIYMYM